jgi:hypothetical protein
MGDPFTFPCVFAVRFASLTSTADCTDATLSATDFQKDGGSPATEKVHASDAPPDGALAPINFNACW